MSREPAPEPSFDEALLARAQAGSAGVVEAYDRYADRLYGYFVRRCGQKELAEDLTSQVFVQFLKSLPKLEWRGVPLEAWLFRAASNLLVDHWRKQGKVFVAYPDDQENGPWEPPSPLPGPDAQTELRLETERLQDVLQRLPPRDQEILDLRFFAGLEPMEMAQTLGISANHASVLVYRALARLRKLYEATYAAPSPLHQ